MHIATSRISLPQPSVRQGPRLSLLRAQLGSFALACLLAGPAVNLNTMPALALERPLSSAPEQRSLGAGESTRLEYTVIKGRKVALVTSPMPQLETVAAEAAAEAFTQAPQPDEESLSSSPIGSSDDLLDALSREISGALVHSRAQFGATAAVLRSALIGGTAGSVLRFPDAAGATGLPAGGAGLADSLADALRSIATAETPALAWLTLLTDSAARTSDWLLPQDGFEQQRALAAAAASASAIVAFTAATGNRGRGAHSEPYPQRAYDPSAARAFYLRRPLEVGARAAAIALRSLGFLLTLLADSVNGKLGAKADLRATSLVELLTSLGPTFIKAGQSASIRTDLLPEAYIRALTKLQDQVPPFSRAEAEQIVAQELGSTAASLFRGGLPQEAVAAASLGQVYKATTIDGTSVAVKVQRPQMLRTIALDMFLIRDVAAPLAAAFGVPGDLQGTADEWGRGFVAELDYEREAANANRFIADVGGSPLEGKVFAPTVVSSLSKTRVLTTEWVEGERLDRASVAEDVPRLCSIAMIAYLQMMLDSGVLHCDPHPGNLLRTADGRLCILDWGLVTSIAPDLQLTLIEHVAHLTAADYAKVPNDLVRLGFVPGGGEEVVMQNGVVDFLTYTYSTWTSGGGASKLDVPALFARVRELAADSADGLFQVPPYFAYIAKSFSVLEGIGLSSDPNYSIVAETLPYISQRIITDPSPRTAGALQTFVFGDTKELESRVLNAARVQTLLDGAKRYKDALSPSQQSEAELEAAAEALLDVLLAATPTPLQELIVEQLALLIGAGSRDVWATLRSASGSLGQPLGGADKPRSRLGAIVDPLGLFRDSALVRKDERDEAALEAARTLAEVARELLPDTSSVDPQQLAATLSRKLWARRDGLGALSRSLVAKLLEQTSLRLSG